jgi:hypothetical protein
MPNLHWSARMAQILNLRVARKPARRAQENTKAKANRAAHGRPAAEQKRDEARRNQAARALDRHRIEPGHSS